MRTTFYLFMILLLVPLATGTVVVEYSMDNSTWLNASAVISNEGFAVVEGLEEGQLYYFRIRNDTSGFTYFNERTATSGEKGMSSLSITGFILLITLGLFALPSIFKRFSSSDILDTTLKGICYILGLLLLSLDTAMMATLSDTFSLGLTDELFTYLFIINWAAYLAIVIVVLTFGYKVLKLWGLKKENKRMGLPNDED